ncbi:HAMP domain-containing histidine kinase [Lachnospiraceae bacterium OttesenSCG-928-J05]|nr:HAMP domain-containing histidine kinase [Lachnospiraceae bacterium OttesenSCG-928-J05]
MIQIIIGGVLILVAALFFQRRYLIIKTEKRVKELTLYLEKVNTGETSELFQIGEDEFSKLQDEMYKTVTQLYQTREMALRSKKNYAENLYNIAHQLKTPITAMNLSLQMLEENPSSNRLEQVRQQLARLTTLEESLLLLSRIDAGTLTFARKSVDVYTVLVLASDNLYPLAKEAGVTMEIPEGEPLSMSVDLEWTMESIINLMKNCLEHTPRGGKVYCSYEENSLYTRILIRDTGAGFAKEDLPHLFERFYRGAGEKEGLGIGLALSKAIIESQDGTITARNHEEGGACFEIHFYHSH